MTDLGALLAASAALHRHLCPRQVLGIRMGLRAGQALDIDVPQTGKRLLTIVETDGCAADGVAVATNCWIGRRTMRVMDFGKVAAVFVDTRGGQAVRIVPRPEARSLARQHAAGARSTWEAQLLGYQVMPDEALLHVQTVTLTVSLRQLLSRPRARAVCAQCGEEILNEREVLQNGLTLCRACAGQRYYSEVAAQAADSHSQSLPPTQGKGSRGDN